VQRTLEYGLDAARLYDATGISDGDGVSNLCGQTEVVGDENHPHAQFFRKYECVPPFTHPVTQPVEGLSL
jgi:hypothetical protein